MAFTTHGHHIPNTEKGPVDEWPKSVKRCGGVRVCKTCMAEVARVMLASEPAFSHVDFMTRAKIIVADYVNEHLDKSDPQQDFETYVVWFCKTLQNWKALLSTTLPDGMYYEVTYNGDKKETYLDAYKKFENVVIKD